MGPYFNPNANANFNPNPYLRPEVSQGQKRASLHSRGSHWDTYGLVWGDSRGQPFSSYQLFGAVRCGASSDRSKFRYFWLENSQNDRI